MKANKHIFSIAFLLLVVAIEILWIWHSDNIGTIPTDGVLPSMKQEPTAIESTTQPMPMDTEAGNVRGNADNLANLFSPEPVVGSTQKDWADVNTDRLGLELVGVGIIGERRTAIIRQAARGRGDASSEKRSYSEREAVGDTGYRIATINPTYVELTNGREDFVLRVRTRAPSDEDDSGENPKDQAASESADTQDAETKSTPAVVAERHKKLLNYRETKPGEDPKSILPSQAEIDYYKAHPEVARERFEKIVAALEAEKQKDAEEEESIAK